MRRRLLETLPYEAAVIFELFCVTEQAFSHQAFALPIKFSVIDAGSSYYLIRPYGSFSCYKCVGG